MGLAHEIAIPHGRVPPRGRVLMNDRGYGCLEGIAMDAVK